MVTAWQELEAMGGRPLLAPRLLQAGTSLLTPGIIEMTGVTGVPDEEVFGPLLRVWRWLRPLPVAVNSLWFRKLNSAVKTW